MPFRHRVQEFEMATALLVLFLVALSSQPHADAQAPQHLKNPDSQRTSSLSGQMSIRFLQNSSYTFALCLPPAPDGRTPYELLIEVHPMLLRDADVRFIIRHYSPRPASLPSPDYTPAISPLGPGRIYESAVRDAVQHVSGFLDSYFFEHVDRFEVALVAEFKNNSRGATHERLSARFTRTCQHLPPPPPPMSAPSSLEPNSPSDPPSLHDLFARVFLDASSCITPACIARAYRRHHDLALNHLTTSSSCASSAAAADCPAAPRIDFLIFRFIPGTPPSNYSNTTQTQY